MPCRWKCGRVVPRPCRRHDGGMTTRRGLFVAPFDALADPRVIGDLAASAEAAGWDGLFVWDHMQYGERVDAIADVWRAARPSRCGPSGWCSGRW